MVIGTFDILAF